MTWWSLYLETSWNNTIWSLKLGIHFLYKWTFVWFQNLTWRYSSRMHTARLETVRASVSVATTRCRFREVPPPDLTCPRWGSTPLTWPVPGGYPTMWPITWRMWCYLHPLPVQTDAWKHYLPTTSFASGDELMHIQQDFAVHLNWYYLGFICSLFLCDFIHLCNGSCLKLKGRGRILLSLILYLYLCWYSRYFYGCFTSSVLSHWTLMISKTAHSVECYNYEF